jgi:pimeloyl-ACP methyl ester carboxylesterase
MCRSAGVPSSLSRRGRGVGGPDHQGGHPAVERVGKDGQRRFGDSKVGPEVLAQFVFSLFYAPGGPAALPAAVDSLSHGNTSVLTSQKLSIIPQPTLSTGVELSVLCAEEVARSSTPAGVGSTPFTKAMFTNGVLDGPDLWTACGSWKVPPAPASLFEPVKTSVPTLIVSGEFDHVTPPAYAQKVAANIPGSVLIEAQGVGHSALLAEGDCGRQILEKFVADPKAPVNHDCADQPVVFLTPSQLDQRLSDGAAPN